MLRFFDREVVCIFENELNRQEILNWFFKNGLDEMVCVTDERGVLKGYITYYSLIVCNEAEAAV